MDIIDVVVAAKKAGKLLRETSAVGYEEVTVYGMTVDTDVTGKVTDSTGTFVKISDNTPTMDEFNGQMATVVSSGGEILTKELELGNTIQQIADDIFVVCECFFVVSKSGVVVGQEPEFVFPEAGVYSMPPQAFAENKWESVTVALKTIHTVDPKYLPGVCLPVVELTTGPTVEGAALTEAESALMNEVGAMGMPIVLKAPFDETCTMAMPMPRFADIEAGAIIYQCSTGTEIYTLYYTGSIWLFLRGLPSDNTEEV